MRVVVAPDKFKGSATATEVASAIAAGLRAGRPDLDIVELPVADGGDGTVAAAVAAGFTPVTVTADGPTGQPVRAMFALSSGWTAGERTAVIELAEVAGLRRLPPVPRSDDPGRSGQPDPRSGPALARAGRSGQAAPLTASTYGLGQLIRAALDRGARTIVLGVGGSASTDGGAGMLQALGVMLADRHGQGLARGGAALLDLALVDLAGLDQRLGSARFLVASDVDSPLLGTGGAAAVFGPQKGAGPGDVAVLERALSTWAGHTRAVTGQDLAAAAGAGAAGGTGFAALAYLGARLMPGIDLVLDLIGFDTSVTGAGLVITGEGRLDAQTLRGKAPIGVARAAARHGVPVAVVAGQVLLTDAEIRRAGFAAAYSLAAIEPDTERSIARTAWLLDRVGRQIAAALES
jgi:glycerate kinase